MMNFQKNPSLLKLFLSIFSLKVVLILIQLIPHASSIINSEEFNYPTCGSTFDCGKITRISYPFRGTNDPLYCGYPGLVLSCDGDAIARIKIKNMTYRVLDVYQATRTMRIAREDVMVSTCPTDLVNTTLDYALFDYASSSVNLTFLYGCPEPFSSNLLSYCGRNNDFNSPVYALPGAQGPGRCNSSVIYPVEQMGMGEVGVGGTVVNYTGLDQILRQGFDVRWKVDDWGCSDCDESGGKCGYDFISNKTSCFCPTPPYVTTTCSVSNGRGGSPRSAGQPSRGTFELFFFSDQNMMNFLLQLILNN